jgi:hypothetical protein
MEWWIFKIQDGEVNLMTVEELPPRPSDAREPENGDPYTPWYELQEHWDDEHIHIKAPSKEVAEIKAKNILAMRTA